MKPYIPNIKTWREALFYAHFGPIGAGALLSALLIRGRLTPGSGEAVDSPAETAEFALFLDRLWSVAFFVVVCSSVVHGTSVALFSLGKLLNRLTITMGYKKDPDESPSWMYRLPHISTQGRSLSRATTFDWDDEREMAIPRLQLRRQVTSNSDDRRSDQRNDAINTSGESLPSTPPESKRKTESTTAAQAFQFGHTVIIEDENGEVVKQYNIRTPKTATIVVKDASGAIASKHTVVSTQTAAIIVEDENGKTVEEHRIPLPLHPPEHAARTRGFLDGFGRSSRRLSTDEFLQQMQNLEPRAHVRVADLEPRKVSNVEMTAPPIQPAIKNAEESFEGAPGPATPGLLHSDESETGSTDGSSSKGKERADPTQVEPERSQSTTKKRMKRVSFEDSMAGPSQPRGMGCK